MKTIIHSFIGLLPLMAASAARAEAWIDESFDGADGPLVAVSDGRWVTHSGTTGQVTVSEGLIRLSGARTEDVRRTVASGGVTNGMLFAGLDLRFRGLPSPTGTYFFHFKDTVDSGSASVFTGRIHATTAGAAAGALRVGVSWGTGAPVMVARDIATNEWVHLVLRLDLGATNAVLWVNPATEKDVANRAMAGDGRGIGQGLSQAAFRQATGLGEVEVDRLRVGARFEDVGPTGMPQLAVGLEGQGVRVRMPSQAWLAGWRLEVAGTLRGPWTQGPELTAENGEATVWIPSGPQSLWFRLVRR